jgi:hypothetical protein
MIFAFLFTVLWSSNAWAENKYVGAIWKVKVKNEKTGKYVDYGLIRCTADGKVYRDGKVVGSHKNTALDKVKMVITGAKDPTNNGTWKATCIKKDASLWGGVYTRKSDGKEFAVYLILQED